MKRFRRHGTFQPGEIILSDPAMRTRVAFQRVTPEDLGVMAQWQSTIEDAMDTILTTFYDYISQTPETRGILTQHTTVER